MKKINFLIRAFNDLDCRMSLIDEYLKRSNFQVNIIFFPTNSGLINPSLYKKNINYLKSKGANILYFPTYRNNFSLSSLLLIFRNLINKLSNNLLDNKLLFFLDSIIIKFVNFLSKNQCKKFYEIISNSTIIIDEIIFQTSRSDSLKNILINSKEFRIRGIQTGQDTYLGQKKISQFLKKDLEFLDKFDYEFYVPSKNDKRIFDIKTNNKKIKISGNTRFDKHWLKKIYQNSFVTKKIKKNNDLKILFLLSKFEYGVNITELVKVINKITEISNFKILIKPHTRGMQTKDFISDLNREKIILDFETNSNQLIEDSDIIFFTGTSMIFQGLILKKKIIFLKNCLYWDSIFDNSNIYKIKNIHQINTDIFKISDEFNGLDDFLSENVFNNLKSGLVSSSLIKQLDENK